MTAKYLNPTTGAQLYTNFKEDLFKAAEKILCVTGAAVITIAGFGFAADAIQTFQTDSGVVITIRY